jgi:hypothetical protein
MLVVLFASFQNTTGKVDSMVLSLKTQQQVSSACRAVYTMVESVPKTGAKDFGHVQGRFEGFEANQVICVYMAEKTGKWWTDISNWAEEID